MEKISVNEKLFKNPKEAIKYGQMAKDTPEDIGVLTERLIRLVNCHICAIQTNIMMYHEACFEFMNGDISKAN